MVVIELWSRTLLEMMNETVGKGVKGDEADGSERRLRLSECGALLMSATIHGHDL